MQSEPNSSTGTLTRSLAFQRISRYQHLVMTHGPVVYPISRSARQRHLPPCAQPMRRRARQTQIVAVWEMWGFSSTWQSDKEPSHSRSLSKVVEATSHIRQGPLSWRDRQLIPDSHETRQISLRCPGRWVRAREADG